MNISVTARMKIVCTWSVDVGHTAACTRPVWWLQREPGGFAQRKQKQQVWIFRACEEVFFHFAHQQWGVNNGSAHLSAVLIDVSSPFTPSWVLPLTQVEVTGYGGSALCSGVNITANNLPCADKPPAETTGGRFYWIINVLTLQWLHVFYSL